MKYQLRYDGRKLRSFFDNGLNRKPNFDEGLNWCMKDRDCFALVRVGYLGSGWMWIAVKKLSTDEIVSSTSESHKIAFYDCRNKVSHEKVTTRTYTTMETSIETTTTKATILATTAATTAATTTQRKQVTESALIPVIKTTPPSIPENKPIFCQQFQTIFMPQTGIKLKNIRNPKFQNIHFYDQTSNLQPKLDQGLEWCYKNKDCQALMRTTSKNYSQFVWLPIEDFYNNITFGEPWSNIAYFECVENGFYQNDRAADAGFDGGQYSFYDDPFPDFSFESLNFDL